MIKSIKNPIKSLSKTPLFKIIREFVKIILQPGSIKKNQGEMDMINLVKSTIRKLSKKLSLKVIWDLLKIALNLSLTEQYAKILYSKLHVLEPWNIDYLQFNNDFIEINGWALTTQGNHVLVNYTINDKDFDTVKYPILREDVRTVFWYYPQSEKSGFFCRAKLTKREAIGNGPIVFKYINRETRQPINIYQNYYYYEDNLALPDARRMERISGYDNEVMFRFTGYSTYAKLELILKNIFNKSYENFSNILDWGCGCGRITRYFENLKSPSITGVDIDTDNIGWCNKYLKFGNFLSIPLHPPTSLGESHFDLIIGISVFTHLKEKEQYEWLGELARIAAKDAILLMSIHSNDNICRSNFSLSFFTSWWNNGISIIDYPRPDLEEMLDETDYYKGAYHTHRYIMRNWSRYFKIVDIIPACIGNIQDLVIMRKI